MSEVTRTTLERIIAYAMRQNVGLPSDRTATIADELLQRFRIIHRQTSDLKEHHGPQLYGYNGHVIRWVDGDTVDMVLSKEVDFGFGFSATHRYKVRCRLLGVDTPERGDEPGFSDARMFNELHCPVGMDVSVRTDWDPSKYGQPLVDIIGPNDWSLSHALIEAGLGKPYFGGTKS